MKPKVIKHMKFSLSQVWNTPLEKHILKIYQQDLKIEKETLNCVHKDR
jgi:hypothetical protein